MPLKLDLVWHEALLETGAYVKLCMCLLWEQTFVNHTARTALAFVPAISVGLANIGKGYEAPFGKDPRLRQERNGERI